VSVTAITRNCVHRFSPNLVCRCRCRSPAD